MNNSTRKREIVARIAKKLGMNQLDIQPIVQQFLNEIIEELGQGNKLEFRDFGIFKVVQRKARMGRNPRTGESVEVPSKRTVKFKPGRLMQHRVTGGKLAKSVVMTNDFKDEKESREAEEVQEMITVEKASFIAQKYRFWAVERWNDEESVRKYFTRENLLAVCSEEEIEETNETLAQVAEIVIGEGWHWARGRH